MNIDPYMIQKAEEEHRVKNMLECVVSENSWKLSENFERNCIERQQAFLEEDIKFSFDMQSEIRDEDCEACFVQSGQSKSRKLSPIDLNKLSK